MFHKLILFLIAPAYPIKLKNFIAVKDITINRVVPYKGWKIIRCNYTNHIDQPIDISIVHMYEIYVGLEEDVKFNDNEDTTRHVATISFINTNRYEIEFKVTKLRNKIKIMKMLSIVNNNLIKFWQVGYNPFATPESLDNLVENNMRRYNFDKE